MPHNAFVILMKKILFALVMLAFGASALQQARGQDVSVDFFYDNLSGGNWIDVEGYGYGWQPDLAVNDQSWRPYADGYWAYTDDGWTWVSYEDFGWATYHYGRWANLSDYGWVWFPGEDLDWGPAWVSWRTGGDYVGWAPLPPRGPGVVYAGRPIGPQVDIEFDIGPEYYNFCEVRYIGEPVLRSYIAPRVQNVTYINNTVNVTNITVQNNVVYNYGPNYEVLSAHSNRPIQRLSIERQSATNLSVAAKSGGLTKVQGNKLVVAAPPRLAKAPPTAKPAIVKTRVAQPKINRGWAGVQNEAQLKQKIKTENPKNVPPPTAAAARAPGGASPAVGASPASPDGGAARVSPAPRGKPGRVPPAATGAPVRSPAAVSPSPFERGKPGGRPTPGVKLTPAGLPRGASPSPFERGRGRPGGPPQPGATTSPAGGASRELTSPGSRASPLPREQVQPRRDMRQGATPGAGQPGGPPNTPEQGRGKTPEIRRGGTTPPAGPGAPEPRAGAQRGQSGYGQPGQPPAGAGPGEPRGVKERGQPGVNRPAITPPPSRGADDARGGRGQGAYGQPGGQPKAGAPAPVERGQAQPERGKKKGEGTPPPRGPQ
ncbi:MAG: hypothetical protein DME65_06095 [Verrucomicrobia bacterium]|nr:MAG: hypothetical protein DME65_06095 [Verrucomicrobiota bacterium]